MLAFELENRDYFARSVTDRGDEFYEAFSDRHDAFLAEQDAGVSALYVLVDRDGSIVGRFNLYDLEDGAADVGYRVAERVAGRGVATDALRDLCRKAANDHGLRALSAETTRANVASQRVLEKVGFIATANCVVDGKPGLKFTLALAGEDTVEADSQELENPLFARFFHRFCGRDRGRGEQDLRRELLAGISGRVVEVGAGNGINFEHYPATVAELVAVEPEPYLRSQAEKAATEARVPVRVVPGVAASLGVDDGSADVVVVSGVLCSVPDQRDALLEFRRVLGDDGELRFYEHVRSQRPAFARWQRCVDPLWSRFMGGCHTDRDTLAAIKGAGFQIDRCRSFGFPPQARAYPVAPRILGVARPG